MPRLVARRIEDVFRRLAGAAKRRASTGDRAVCILPHGRRCDRSRDRITKRRCAICIARLDLIYAGVPGDIAADRAFADCALHFGIPKQYPLALLEGFEWDAIGRRYEDLSALQVLRRARCRHGGRDDGHGHERARAPTWWRAPAISASPCSSPTSRATSAKMRATAVCTCRCNGCARPGWIRMRGSRGPSSAARLAQRDRAAAGRGARRCTSAATRGWHGCRRPAGRACMRPGCCMRRSATKSRDAGSIR